MELCPAGTAGTCMLHVLQKPCTACGGDVTRNSVKPSSGLGRCKSAGERANSAARNHD